MRCNDSHSAKHAWQFGPCLDACLSHLAHPVVKLLLIAAIRLDLTWVATDYDEVKAFAQLKEGIVLFVRVADQLAATGSSCRLRSCRSRRPWNHSGDHCCSCLNPYRAGFAQKSGKARP